VAGQSCVIPALSARASPKECYWRVDATVRKHPQTSKILTRYVLVAVKYHIMHFLVTVPLFSHDPAALGNSGIHCQGFAAKPTTIHDTTRRPSFWVRYKMTEQQQKNKLNGNRKALKTVEVAATTVAQRIWHQRCPNSRQHAAKMCFYHVIFSNLSPFSTNLTYKGSR